MIAIANVGDSRAVLATISDEGSVVADQLTVDFKPNLPCEYFFSPLKWTRSYDCCSTIFLIMSAVETERILQCNGRVFSLEDEPSVHRVWLPDEESPGLAMSRAFGDYCIKDHGLISVPEVTHRHITGRDQFVVLATDGVCMFIALIIVSKCTFICYMPQMLFFHRYGTLSPIKKQ